METFEVFGAKAFGYKTNQVRVSELECMNGDCVFKAFRAHVEDWAGTDVFECRNLCPDTEEEKALVLNRVVPMMGHPVFRNERQLVAYYCVMGHKGFNIVKLNAFRKLVEGIEESFYNIEEFDEADGDEDGMPRNAIELAMNFHWYR